MVNWLQPYLVASALVRRRRKIQGVRSSCCCWSAQLPICVLLTRGRNRTISSRGVVIKRLQMDIHFVFMEGFAIVEVVHILTIAVHLLSHWVIMIVTARISQVLPSSFRDALITRLGFLISQAVYRTVACDILLSNLNSSSCRWVSEVIVTDIIALAKAFINPGLVSSSHIIFVAILVISRMVVHIVKPSLISRCYTCYIHCVPLVFCRPIPKFLCFLLFLLEVCLTEIILLCWVFWLVLNIKFSLLLGLFYPRLSIDWREWNFLILWVKSEKWNCPVSSFVIPLRLIMQFIQFVLSE